MNREISCVSAASNDSDRAKWCQDIFHAPFFRHVKSTSRIYILIEGYTRQAIHLGSRFQEHSRM